MFLFKLRFQVIILALLISVYACKKDSKDSDEAKPVTSIISVFPNEAGKDAVVVIKGSYLMAGSVRPTVTINGRMLEILSASADSISVRIPKMLGSGKVIVAVNGHDYEGPEFLYKYKATVTTIAGTGLVGKDNGSPESASFFCPWGLAVDKDDNIYVADSYNRLIRFMSKKGYVSTITIPNNIDGGWFGSPNSIAVDKHTNDLYVTDFNRHVIKMTQAGVFSMVYDGEMATAGIAIGSDGYLYVCNTTTGTILKMNRDGKGVSNFSTGLSTPRNLVFDKGGNMFVSAYDMATASSAIFAVDQSGKSTIKFPDPPFQGWEIAVDTLGNFYEADHFSNRIRLIEKSGRIVTIAGSGKAADVDGVGLAASFDGPQGLTICSDGQLYVSTFNYETNTGNRIRKVVLE